jgi:hypothetical protein
MKKIKPEIEPDQISTKFYTHLKINIIDISLCLSILEMIVWTVSISLEKSQSRANNNVKKPQQHSQA